MLKDFLIKVLQLDEQTAEVTACRMEHAVDEASIDRLVSFVEYIDHLPAHGIGLDSILSRPVQKCQQILG